MNNSPITNTPQPCIPIIVLNWNGIGDTEECIPTILNQTHSHFKIYLVDNGSANEEGTKLKAKYGNHPKIQFIANATNLGFTKAHNQIFNQYILPANHYEFVVLLNNDTVVEKNWLEELVKFANSHQASMVTSKMINYYARTHIDNAGHHMLNTGEILPIGNDDSTSKYNQAFENIGACGGGALYRTDMLRDIGIFDDFFDSGYEDAELGLRAVLLGHKAIFAPTAIVYHKVSRSINKIRDYEYALKIQLNIYYTCIKLLPLSVMAIHFIPFLFKVISVFVINAVFFRKKFLRVWGNALYLVLFKNRKMFLEKRKIFQKKYGHCLKNKSILKKMTFFFWFDIKRFVKYILLRQKTVYERF